MKGGGWREYGDYEQCRDFGIQGNARFLHVFPQPDLPLYDDESAHSAIPQGESGLHDLGNDGLLFLPDYGTDGGVPAEGYEGPPYLGLKHDHEGHKAYRLQSAYDPVEAFEIEELGQDREEYNDDEAEDHVNGPCAPEQLQDLVGDDPYKEHVEKVFDAEIKKPHLALILKERESHLQETGFC